MLDAKTFLIADDLSRPFTSQLGIKDWDSNWVLVEGNYYLLQVFLFDRDKHPIHLTENLVFSHLLDADHFDLVKVNLISSEIVVRAKKATLPD